MDPATIDQLIVLIPVVIFCLAGLIVALIGTFGFVLLRRSNRPGEEGLAVPVAPPGEAAPAEPGPAAPPPLATDVDPDTYLAEQKSALQEFSLADLSNTFRGVTGQGYRQGVIVHHRQPDVPLIAFATQTSGGQMGLIKATTTYGEIELTVTAGRADVVWKGDKLGTLDYQHQRVLGPEGQLLGEINRPAGALNLQLGDQHYPISFFGQKAGELHYAVQGLSSLRWLSDTEEEEQPPAFSDLNPELNDTQQVFMMTALVMEVGFFDFLGAMQ
ncbi:MAG: hypothetical protein ACE5H9_02870 [Anaerolineae bacterium]